MTDEEHKCHCRHVVVIYHDYKRITWAVGLMFTLTMALAIKEIVAAEKSHIRDSAPMPHTGERMFEDRVERE